jgi:hypothetical protein
MNIPYYTWDYMDYKKNIYIYMDYEPLTKGDAHPSIVSIQEAETYLHDIIDDVSTTISRFPALLSMMLYDWGLLYIIIYIYILCAWIFETISNHVFNIFGPLDKRQIYANLW